MRIGILKQSMSFPAHIEVNGAEVHKKMEQMLQETMISFPGHWIKVSLH